MLFAVSCTRLESVSRTLSIMKEHATAFAIALLAVALCPSRQILADTEATHNPYSGVLLTNGISPDAKGVTAYLERVRPSAEATRRVSKLIRDLGDGSFRVREAAENKLATMGLIAEHAVKEAARSDDPEVITRAKSILKKFSVSDDIMILHAAIKTVGLTKPKEAVSLLFDIIPLCASRHLRYAVDEALLITVKEGDKKLLLKAIETDNILVRSAALPPLAKILGSEGRTDLYPYLKDPHPMMRITAARVLADFGDRICLAHLSDLLTANDLEIRSSAASVLRQVTQRHFGYAAYAEREDRIEGVTA